MCHTSPASLLVWAVMSSFLGLFFVFHLWQFDRFKSLKWNSGPYSGAFKRVMTYSYLISIPLLVAYSIGFTIIKYDENYTLIPTVGIVPTPWQLWTPAHRKAIFPLYLMFSVAWSLEMVTHLEELCFWLFLINAGSAQQDWFRSVYFRSWCIGSLCAVLYMPLVTTLTRADPLRCEAYTFLSGSLGSLSLTIWFLPVLWTFPSFLNTLRQEGVDTPTLVRLTKFHELNTIRVLFRFLFVLPFLILSVDGIQGHAKLNRMMVVTDVLASLAAVGLVVSSAITLVIFFPRSIEGEIMVKDMSREKKSKRSTSRDNTADTRHSSRASLGKGSTGHRYLLTSSPVKTTLRTPSPIESEFSPRPYASGSPPPMKSWRGTSQSLLADDSRQMNVLDYTPVGSTRNVEVAEPVPHTVPFRPNRRSDWEEDNRNKAAAAEEAGALGLTDPSGTPLRPYSHSQSQSQPTSPHAHPPPQRPRRSKGKKLAKVNPLVLNYTSPIDLVYGSFPVGEPAASSTGETRRASAEARRESRYARYKHSIV